MTLLTAQQKKEYETNGFLVLKNFLSDETVQGCLNDFEAYLTAQGKSYGFINGGSKNLDELIKTVMKPGTKERGFIYDTVRFIPSIRAIQTAPQTFAVLKELGLAMPMSLEFPSIRIDIPGESKFLTKTHQDIRSIRSPKCITFWFPFRPCNKETGTIAVYAGSHKKGLLPHIIVDGHVKVEDKYLPPESDLIIAEANPGDAIFMSSFCVHKSWGGSTEKVKLNGQSFYDDGLEIKLGDQYESLKNIPDYKDIK